MQILFNNHRWSLYNRGWWINKMDVAKPLSSLFWMQLLHIWLIKSIMETKVAIIMIIQDNKNHNSSNSKTNFNNSKYSSIKTQSVKASNRNKQTYYNNHNKTIQSSSQKMMICLLNFPWIVIFFILLKTGTQFSHYSSLWIWNT